MLQERFPGVAAIYNRRKYMEEMPRGGRKVGSRPCQIGERPVNSCRLRATGFQCVAQSIAMLLLEFSDASYTID